MTAPEFWRKCSSCKKPIGFSRKYWVCSVSTCNRARTGLVFCTVACFDAHVPMMNHKDAGAIEKHSPTAAEWAAESAEPEKTGVRRIVGASESGVRPTPSAVHGSDSEKQILVVVSKTKDYVRAKSGYNTSEAVMELLSNKIRSLLDDAIQNATQDGRKTVMDRDFR